MPRTTAREISLSDALTELPLEKEPTIKADAVTDNARSVQSICSGGGRSATVSFRLKLLSVVIVSLIGFGSHWSSGVTGAMKSTLKKELGINNAQYAVLESPQDFMITASILVTGLVAHRVSGAGAIVWVAQYRIFNSWFALTHGFAATLGLELGIGKIGSFVGQATADPFANGTVDFRKYCDRHYSDMVDPDTGQKLRENAKKLELGKVLRLPLPFWGFILFSAFQTSTAVVLSRNATELAEQCFNVDSVKTGWYSATSQYLGFFLVPCLGLFIDVFGNRLAVLSSRRLASSSRCVLQLLGLIALALR